MLCSANPLSTDVEIAYQRLLGQGACDVKAWFNDFCDAALRGEEGGEGEEEGAEEEEEEVSWARGRGAGWRAGVCVDWRRGGWGLGGGACAARACVRARSAAL